MSNQERKEVITFISGNKHKFQELKDILEKEVGNRYVLEMRVIDLPEIQGTDIEIIKEKAVSAIPIVHSKFIVEDSALEFIALNGMPGPYIKSFLTSIGNKGLVKMLSAFDDKRAKGICNIAYYDQSSIRIFTGVIEGKIVEEAGTSSFGWDNIFMPNGYDKRFGEMTKDMKNSISHRSIAVNKLIKHLKGENN